MSNKNNKQFTSDNECKQNLNQEQLGRLKGVCPKIEPYLIYLDQFHNVDYFDMDQESFLVIAHTLLSQSDTIVELKDKVTITCSNCQKKAKCFNIHTGFAGESENLCNNCLDRLVNDTESRLEECLDTIIKLREEKTHTEMDGKEDNKTIVTLQKDNERLTNELKKYKALFDDENNLHAGTPEYFYKISVKKVMAIATR